MPVPRIYPTPYVNKHLFSKLLNSSYTHAELLSGEKPGDGDELPEEPMSLKNSTYSRSMASGLTQNPFGLLPSGEAEPIRQRQQRQIQSSL